MKSKAQKAALLEVETLQVKITKMLRAKDDLSEYLYQMWEIELRLDTYLEEVDKMSKEHDLNGTIPLEFKKEATEEIYASAMERREYKWASYFAKEYEL